MLWLADVASAPSGCKISKQVEIGLTPPDVHYGSYPFPSVRDVSAISSIAFVLFVGRLLHESPSKALTYAPPPTTFLLS